MFFDADKAKPLALLPPESESEKRQKLKAFIAALRSGRYVQSRGRFYGNRRGKCLSACAIGSGLLNCNVRMSMNTITQQRTAANLLGIREWTLYKIVEMNDDDKKSFDEIADWLEKKILPRTK